MDDDASPLAGTEVHYLRSESVGDEFKVFVGHCGTPADTPAAVLYVTDANGFFGMAVDAIRSMQLARHLPPMLVVGIGYRRGALADTVPLRTRDLTPSRDETFTRVYPECTESGGGPRMLRFIRTELMPWVADHYLVNPHDAAYFGHSLGGLFGTYVLLDAPDTFSRYIIGGPSYWWDYGMIFRLEKMYAAEHRDLVARVFFGIGAAENVEGRNREAANLSEDERAITAAFPIDMVVGMQKFVDRLTSHDYPGLTVAREVFADEFHITVAPLVLSRGLRRLFDAPTTTAPSAG
jgi:predicted alpha/beta superfamily hydrolase